MGKGGLDHAEAAQSPRLRRVEHPGRILAVTVALAIVAGGSFVAGRLVEAPSRETILAAQEPITVVARVERRIVDARVNFAASVRDGEALDLLVESQQSPTVVVRRTLNPGDIVQFGSMIGVVSGEPYFALKAPLPMFRDLARGAAGDDVTAFQESLNAAGFSVPVSGKVDYSTFVAVRSLFQRNGFELPWGTSIPYRQFLAISNASSSVVTAADVGVKLSSSTPLASIQIQPQHVYFRADAVESAELAVGDTMNVRANGGATFDGSVESIGLFGQGEEGQGPGRDVVIVSADPRFLELAAGTALTVLGEGQSTETVAVPITSLRQDNDGDYVDREVTVDGLQQFERVAVGILYSGGGWVALDDTGLLRVGDKVRVS